MIEYKEVKIYMKVIQIENKLNFFKNNEFEIHYFYCLINFIVYYISHI